MDHHTQSVIKILNQIEFGFDFITKKKMLHGEYLKCIKHIFFEQAPRNELLLKMQPL